MNLLCLGDSSLFEALLAQRVLTDISIPNLLPSVSIPFLFFLGPSILLVFLVHEFLMLLTVPSIRQLWTTRIGARALGFHWHPVHPHEKSP